MTAVAERWLIRGRVQGVGYRDWMVREARGLGVAGWVRNRGNSEVEALVAGLAEAIAALREACRRGPPLASVSAIEVAWAETPTEQDFARRPSC